MCDERTRILEMLDRGMISIEEAKELLNGLGPPGRTNTMNENPPVPTSLKVVAALFIFGGICAILEVIISLMNDRLNINFGVLGVFIGPGLLQLRPGWRTCALVFIWVGLIFLPIAFLAMLVSPGPFDLKLFDQTVGHIPKLVGLFLAALIFLLVFWQYRVLTRPDVRALFLPERNNVA